MNEEIMLRALVQKAQEMDDEYLVNEKLVKMLIKKQVSFDNYDKINEFLNFIKDAKTNAQKSK
ncbi:hypothetical protein AVBRAN12642_08295 [Campylobacter sp. RM12642]|uniref:hypothetical protein n=1 Tax=unclassified Campylobacter TaxID=2593542 RepID=UPI001D2CDDC7|nr:hypothetical protein [Campylobacter sp. RM12642]MBZ8007005.1 hypothetical protein [Campylobacter sp. RM9334]